MLRETGRLVRDGIDGAGDGCLTVGKDDCRDGALPPLRDGDLIAGRRVEDLGRGCHEAAAAEPASATGRGLPSRSNAANSAANRIFRHLSRVNSESPPASHIGSERESREGLTAVWKADSERLSLSHCRSHREFSGKPSLAEG